MTIIDKSLPRLKELDLQFGPRATTLFSTVDAIENAVLAADLVIGAVLVPGAAAPKLVTRAMVRAMRPGSVLVDIAIDQGGCFETSRPTTHSAPTYVEEGVVHYCVTNMPGAVARTSTFALNNATIPFVLALADKGWRRALAEDPHLRQGLNVHDGKITHEAVAHVSGLCLYRGRYIARGISNAEVNVMADPEIIALRAKLAQRVPADEIGQRRKDFDAPARNIRSVRMWPWSGGCGQRAGRVDVDARCGRPTERCCTCMAGGS